MVERSASIKKILLHLPAVLQGVFKPEGSVGNDRTLILRKGLSLHSPGQGVKPLLSRNEPFAYHFPGGNKINLIGICFTKHFGKDKKPSRHKAVVKIIVLALPVLTRPVLTLYVIVIAPGKQARSLVAEGIDHAVVPLSRPLRSGRDR